MNTYDLQNRLLKANVEVLESRQQFKCTYCTR